MNITQEQINDLLVEANDYVLLNDRSLYDPFFEAFEKYCSKNNVTYVLLSAAWAILAKDDDTVRPRYDSYVVTVCSERPYDLAVIIANHLTKIESKHIDPRKISITRTASSCSININIRQCFVIHRSPTFRDVTVDSLVGTVDAIGLWTRAPIKCQNIYSILGYLLSQSYDPNGRVDLEIIQRLIEKIRPMLKEGSRDHRKKHEHNKKDDSRKVILNYLSSRVGVYSVPSKGSLSFVIDAPFEDVRKELDKLATIRIMKYNLHDLDDFALTKFVIHDSDEKPVCVIYNSMEHQVIPVRNPEVVGAEVNKNNEGTITKNIKIVSRRFAARIKILEIQMLRMMSHIGHNMSRFIGPLLAEIFELIDSPKFYDEDDIIGYAGTCINWNVLRKTMGKNKGMHTIYAKKDDPAFSLAD